MAGVVSPLLAAKVRVPGRRPEAVARPRLVERVGAGRAADAGVGAGRVRQDHAATEWLAAAGPAARGLGVARRARQRAATLLDLRRSPPCDGRGPASAPARSRCCSRRSRRSRPCSPSLVNDLQRAAGRGHAGARRLPPRRRARDPRRRWRSCSTTCRPSCTWCSPPGPTRRCRWRGCGPAASWSRSAPPTCASPRDEAAAYLDGPMGLALTAADVAALDERTEGWVAALQLAGAVPAGPRRPGAVHRRVRRRRPVRRRLPRRGGARPAARRRPRLPARNLRPRPAHRPAVRRGHRPGRRRGAMLDALDRANLFLVPLDDQRRWYRYHHLFADVLRAHLLDEQPDRSPSCTGGPARWYERARRPRPRPSARAGRRGLRAGRRPDRAGDPGAAPGPAGGRAAPAGSTSCPTRWCGSARCSASAFVGALAQVSDFADVDARLDDIERSLRPDGEPWPERPPPGLVVVDEDGCRALPGRGRDVPGRAGAHRRRPRRRPSRMRGGADLAPPGDDLDPRAAGALAGLASWAPGDLAGAHAAYTESRRGPAPAPASSPTSSAARSPSATSRSPRAGSATPGAPTSGPSSSPRRAGRPAAGHRRHARRHWPGPARTRRPRRRRRAPARCRRARASTKACRRTRTGSGWRWPGCGRPRATSTPRSTCSTRPSGSTTATTPRTCSRSRRCGPGCSCAAASWACAARGRASAAVADDELSLPARVRARHARPAPPRPRARRARTPGRRRRPARPAPRRRRGGRRGGTVIEVLVLLALARQTRGARPPHWPR